jgi:hypothetical protein
MKMVMKDRKMRRSWITTGMETVTVVRRAEKVKVVKKTGLRWTGVERVFPYTVVSQGFSWEISKVREW